MIKTDFIPIDYDYFDFQGKNYAKIIGRNSSGKRICVLDSCPVYLWAILKSDLSSKDIGNLTEKIKKIKLDLNGRQTKVESVELHDKKYMSRDVKALKIFATNYKDLHDIADRLDFKEIECRRGYDLGFITHYINEKKITPLDWYEISGNDLNNSNEFGGLGMHLDVALCIELKSVEKISEEKVPKYKPRALAYDIETDEIKIGDGQILMVSLVSSDAGGTKKVITWKKPKKTTKNLDYVEYVKDEATLLEKFVQHVRKISPDFLVGYFSDGFDLPYLRARADKLKVPLTLGLDESQPRFFRGAVTTGKIAGIVHVDLLRFIETAYSQYMQSETLSLNEVAKEFLGDNKKKFDHSAKIQDHDWENYFEYNLHDSDLTIRLFDKMWPDISEFTKIMSEPVFTITRNGMSSNVEDYIIHNLDRFNEIPEKRPGYDEIGERRKKEKYEGAFVFEPTPGLYEDVCVFDFTSNYGTVIVTYNLSRSTFLGEKTKEKDAYHIELDGKEAYFSKKPGFFPEMLREIIEKRKKYKQELKHKPDAIKQARSNAFKLLANAVYGYQGFFGARYYQREAAAATAGFAKKTIKEIIDKINAQGFTVVYSDTDSIAFLINKKSEAQVLKFLETLNSKLPGIMELELESFYARGLWVTKRDGSVGAKKKYALIEKNGRLKIRGFETVRRDWCKLAREVQNTVLKTILEDGNEKKALVFLKETIKKIKERKVTREEIIIKTMLKKPISEYKSISPHVIAATKMQALGVPASAGNLIEYFIAETREKKKLVRDKVKLPDEKGEYNIKYYLESQVLPAVENIFQVFNINVMELIEGKKQTKLGDF